MLRLVCKEMPLRAVLRMSLFRNVTKAAIDADLSKAAIFYACPSDNPRPINAEQKQNAADKAERKAQRLAKNKQRHEALLKANEALNNLRMLQEHCQMVDISLEEPAKRYGMEDILAQFPQEVTVFQARE